jgi:cobyrinic acid a,c-diamide synthase
LGLVTAAEHGPEAVRVIDAMAKLVAGGVNLDAIVRVASQASPLDGEAWEPPVQQASRPVIAVAGGAAFTFGYAEHAEMLAAAGAEVAVFDPLRDTRLPEGTKGLVLPGGFPEQHAEVLSANSELRAAVADFEGPVHAECGGLLFLVKSLDGHPMCGVLDADASMTPSLLLGYRDAVAASDSALCTEGMRWTGHEFHRTAVTPIHGGKPAWIWRDRAGAVVREGFVEGRVHASYLHTHPVANPGAIARFVRACE